MENEISEAERARRAYTADHLGRYLRSEGTDGHIVDGRDTGGHRFTTTLLLRYKGRKSGRTMTTPLVYGSIGGEVIIAASRGPEAPPPWYLNILASDEVSFQIGGQAFRASWREPDREESERAWRFMESVFPTFRKIRAAASREIPLIMLRPIEEIERFKSNDS